MSYLFTSESVSEGHPDKIADQISDALLDEFLRIDPKSKVACETFVTTGLVVVGGEVFTKGYVEIQDVVRQVIKEIGYTKDTYKFDSESCGIISTIHAQSPDIRQGVEREDEMLQGAGDQGMMFGYACREMDNYMPLPIELAHMLVQELAKIRKETDLMPYLAPDSKSQVTIKYSDDHQPLSIDTILVSTQHDAFDPDERKMQQKIKEDIQNILIPRVREACPERVKKLFDANDYKLIVNPTGKFVIGGPHGDSGLTGRKIIVDTYGGKGAHGGGAFSGKDPSKVDRSAAYAARHIAKNMVAAGICDQVLVQVSYAIGIAEPVSLMIDTYGTAKVSHANGKLMSDSEIADKIKEIFDLRPAAIIKRFQLHLPIYYPTASYGHFGRDPFTRQMELLYDPADPQTVGNCKEHRHTVEAQFFGWEKTDYVDILREAFKL